MKDCFWVSSFQLNFLDKDSWVLDNQIYRIYSNKRPTSNKRPPRISAHPDPTPFHLPTEKKLNKY